MMWQGIIFAILIFGEVSSRSLAPGNKNFSQKSQKFEKFRQNSTILNFCRRWSRGSTTGKVRLYDEICRKRNFSSKRKEIFGKRQRVLSACNAFVKWNDGRPDFGSARPTGPRRRQLRRGHHVRLFNFGGKLVTVWKLRKFTLTLLCMIMVKISWK